MLSLAAGDYSLPVKSMAERRYLTIVRQRYDFSCGSAALATLLRFHYGDLQSEQTIFLGMWKAGDRERIKRFGFSLLDMKRYLEARGIRADGYVVTLAAIEATGIPGIALIDMKGYKHFVVVKGLANGQVLVGDPSVGIRLIPAGTFRSMWNGILFALSDANELGKASFGREQEWALVARSRATMLMEPASLQALALTRAPPYPVEM
ncbi:MAG: peptidase C39 [Burkholderiales bacterium]|nr:MAG: peptidase C39 [Burkholderiales bacterium]